MTTPGDGKKERPKKTPVPIVSNYPLARVFKIRDHLRLIVGEAFLDKTPVAADFDALVEMVADGLPGRVHVPTVADSLRHLAGTKITKELLFDFCWRMAGNVDRIRQRRPVPPWHVQRVPEWVPVQVVSCKRQRNTHGDVGGYFGFRILAGTSCPRMTYKWWSVRMARYLSTSFGYTRPRGRHPAKYPYTQPEQLVGLRCHALVHPDECDKEPGFSTVAFSDAMADWNVTTIRCRLGVEPEFPCLMETTRDELPCHRCPVGHKRCRAATHRSDWVQQECPHCGDEEAWFDPEVVGGMCVACQINSVYKREDGGGK